MKRVLLLNPRGPHTHCLQVQTRSLGLGEPHSTMHSSPSSLPQGHLGSPILLAWVQAANTPASSPRGKAAFAKDIPGFLSWFLGFP